MRPLPPFLLEVHFSKWEFQARHHMCASDMESLRLTDLLALAEPKDREAWDALHLGYTETRGLPALREVIATTFEKCEAAEILCFAGAEEGLFAFMHALLAPQDHAIVLLPNYQSAESVPGTLCEVTGVALDPDRGWDLDLDQVRAAIRPTTRLICINFPNNPTGKVISRARFEGLVDLAREHGLWLFSDEVYRGIERRPELRLPQVADVYERGVSLGVMSKAYGLPGLRIGWIACRDTDLLLRMERIKHYLSICNPAPSELLALIALKARTRILQRNLGIVRENLALLNDFFAEFRDLFAWEEPEGGCVGYPRYLGLEGVEVFTRDLVEQAGVLLLPASIYRSEQGPMCTDRFRIGYGRLAMKEGLAAMSRHILRVRSPLS